MNAPIALQAIDVTIEYQLRRNVGKLRPGLAVEHHRIFTNLNLTIREGESVGFIGKNGSGKSTLLRAFCGLLPVHSGSIVATTRPFLLGVNAVLRSQMTGRKNAELGLLAQGIDGRDIEGLLEEIHEFTELESSFDKPMNTYSSGMRARLHFAIATTLRPRTLLIDEAFAVGDRSFKRKSEARLKDLQREASTLVVVSHNLREIENLCDRSIWIDGGQIRQDGPTSEVIAEYERQN